MPISNLILCIDLGPTPKECQHYKPKACVTPHDSPPSRKTKEIQKLVRKSVGKSMRKSVRKSDVGVTQPDYHRLLLLNT